MTKVFNTAAVCIPARHYMVNIDGRLKEIKSLIDSGQYFTINRARQYGKTTTLMALEQYLRKEYYVVFMDFQMFGAGQFKDENIFARSFARSFLRIFDRNKSIGSGEFKSISQLNKAMKEEREDFMLQMLFEGLSDICAESDKPIVLIIDEVDSAANNQVFLDFLAQLRAYYIGRETLPAFWSVILAGVCDVRNLKRKLRSEEEHKLNSPWNIAADFKVEMSFCKEDIAGMLREYETDYHTGMDIDRMSSLLYEYTSGYPFLVSRLCKLMDEEVSEEESFGTKSAAWTKQGFHRAVRMILSEKNTLFESLIGKLADYPELNGILRSMLFAGKSITYNPDEQAVDMAAMFGFVKNQNNIVSITNRIFETRLYNFYLSASELQGQDIYKASCQDKNQFVINGYLNMRLILERFVQHFHTLYGENNEKFVEEEGRKYFLLYLMPIINGTGNYYIESRTRQLRRTDVIVDYHGEQYVIEMKIWHGSEYNQRGEKQLIGYLADYHVNKGYMLSFCFNKNKQIGVHEIVAGDKTLIEAVV